MVEFSSNAKVFLGNLPSDITEPEVRSICKNYGTINKITVKKRFCFVEFDDELDAKDAIHGLNGRMKFGARIVAEKSSGRGHGRDASRERHRGRRDSRDRYKSRSRDHSREVRRPRDRSRSYSPRRGDRDRYNNYDKNNRYQRPYRTKYVVRIKNIDSSVTWQALKDYMRKAGEVTYGNCHNIFPNEGEICYKDKEGMDNAIKILDNTELNGRRIELKKSLGYDPRLSNNSERRYSKSKSPSRERNSRRSRRSSYEKSRSASRTRSPIEIRTRRSSSNEKRRPSRSLS